MSRKSLKERLTTNTVNRNRTNRSSGAESSQIQKVLREIDMMIDIARSHRSTWQQCTTNSRAAVTIV